MQIKVDGTEYKAVLAATSDPLSNQWNLLNEKGQPFAGHRLPKVLRKGDKFYTSGHQYEIVSV